MKKYLLSNSGKFYKVNLHNHTNISDGSLTPEQTKAAYIEKGYSAVAFTDHDVLIPHNDLTDENFVALNGYEMEINGLLTGKERPLHRLITAHICFVALKPNTTRQPCFHRTKYHVGNGINYVGQVDYDTTLPDYEREYGADCVNDIIKKGRDGGFFVTYNHPTWSGETYNEYMKYDGMHAMEIYNNECILIGADEYNHRVYDDMLRGGKNLYCIATDDMHKLASVGGGYTMIKADKLDYESLTSSLVSGNFYASTGAEIKELYVEDGFLCVTTAPSKCIGLSTEKMQVKSFYDADGNVTQAKFKIEPEYGYMRITVTDKQNNKAYTNAYYVKDLIK